ncbi:hypothetical protein BDDG_12255 [Blastomyces dermatitidis ATCC 18188]|uniref:Uncharacterized protein n=1 Tax=Ajellomyces dermatitidis (strain ATCC 18188 / CBS 674.68) TaxID=653446 RepID=A0A0J9ENS3_AJEDA|nr:hypothetical protein BDDG_12255 [Blastomyces dermatitidis ATCC 18188]
MKKSQNSADSTQQYSEQGSDVLQERNYRLSFSESLFLKSSSSQIPLQMITQSHTSLRNDISLQGTVTTVTAVKEAEEEEDVIMRVILSQLIDITVFTFNLAFLVATEAAAAS